MCFPYYLAFLITDYLGVTIAGCCRGLGRQKTITKYLIISMYLIGIPNLMIMTFYLDMKVKGLWLAFCLNTYLLFIRYWIVLLYKPFEVTIKEYHENMKLVSIE